MSHTAGPIKDLESFKAFLQSLVHAGTFMAPDLEMPQCPSTVFGFSQRQGAPLALQVQLGNPDTLCSMPDVMESFQAAGIKADYAVSMTGMFVFADDCIPAAWDHEIMRYEMAAFVGSVVHQLAGFPKNMVVMTDTKGLKNNVVLFNVCFPCTQDHWQKLMILKQAELEAAEAYERALEVSSKFSLSDLDPKRKLN